MIMNTNTDTNAGIIRGRIADWLMPRPAPSGVTPADISARFDRFIHDAIDHGHEVAYVEVVTYDPAAGTISTHTVDVRIEDVP